MNQNKIDQLLKIINLPIELGMEEFFSDENNNLYYYFYQLNLITKQEVEDIFSNKTPIVSNKHFKHFLENIDYHFCQNIEEETIADVGAGWGHVSFWMLLNGAKKVYSIGDPFRSRFIQELFDAATEKGLLPEDVELVSIGEWVDEGYLSLAKPIGSQELDRCVFIDVFEHIPFYRMPSLFKSCAFNLKEGGKVISTTHNTNSPRIMKEVLEYWDGVELNKEIPARKKVLQDLHSIEDQNTIELLAKNTRGMVRKEFDQAIEAYKNTGEIPVFQETAPTYDIHTDEAHEGPTDYVYLSKLMNAEGFETKVYPTTYNSHKTRWIQPIAKAFPNIFLNQHILDDDICFVGIKKT